MTWPDEAVADGSAMTPAHPSRIALFEAVRADRTGPVATRLLRLTHADSPVVRRAALGLLQSLSHEQPWPEAVDAAVARFGDPDEEVRRRAAWLVGYRGRPDLVLASLGELADPVVRTVLAEALGPTAAHLTGDGLASVRFLAHVETLRAAPSARWQSLDDALLDDAQEAAHHLGDAGRIWGEALYGLGREHDAYTLVARLLDDPGTRDIGADLAREACHDWRIAPVRLLPLLVRHHSQKATPALGRALTTAMISEAAMRIHGALVAAVPVTPTTRARRVPSTATAYDSASAAALLAARPVGVTRLARAPEIFGALLDGGPLTFRQAAQLYNLTFGRPGRSQADCAPLWLRHAGPRALSRVLALMTPHLADYAVGEYYLAGLARMGGHARLALPAVTALIDRRTRIPVNDSTRDAEMRIDESLLAAALSTRRAILTPTAPPPPAGRFPA
ncbi:HEAT repeat domain-containing protein [Streptomyces sp. NBC_00199]|uniref:HEAT repeat domain-containing protein n=1 Tax=Streptomyces sp. NBC_00199 TaxID=2975678 RepID=UPI0022576B35|nr:HEAT repeat domain-containing protein [Streptomyces sp. NBC_00199]MCX5265589.1 HEAT repeat domain-containing protein [Streptomyces sp. NBC_00199]